MRPRLEWHDVTGTHGPNAPRQFLKASAPLIETPAPPSELEILTKELKKLNLFLIKLPGEFAIANSRTAQPIAYCSNMNELREAIKDLSAGAVLEIKPTLRGKGLKKVLSAKSQRRKIIRAHNHRVHARAVKRTREDKKDWE